MCPLQLSRLELCVSANRGGTTSNFVPERSLRLLGDFCILGEFMKRAIGYFGMALAAFLMPLPFLYIGFVSPAKAAAESPLVRMVLCTVLAVAVVYYFTKHIHILTGLAGLDSARLNLCFTAALLISAAIQNIVFSKPEILSYMQTLAENQDSTTGKYFFSYVKYVFMGGQLLVALRTLFHSAVLGVLKAIMRHS